MVFLGRLHPRGGTPSLPDGVLGSQPGDIDLARCLVASNADSTTSFPARGTIFTYGVDGVCHQLANQALYATSIGGAPPLTVAQASGYWVSTAIYGSHGLRPGGQQSRHVLRPSQAQRLRPARLST